MYIDLSRLAQSCFGYFFPLNEFLAEPALEQINNMQMSDLLDVGGWFASLTTDPVA